MKAVNQDIANDVIGGALNPIGAMLKSAQMGYDAGASILGVLGGVAGMLVGGVMGLFGGLFGTVK